MSKRLIYLFGEPGTGKITVARILQKRLGWRLFWVHDLDAVCAIVGRYPLPRLMDKVSLAVLEEMMREGQDVLYVRPSRDLETITKVLTLADVHGYKSYPIRLWADRKTLVERVSRREKSESRVSNEEELDRYLKGRPASGVGVSGVYTLSTERQTPDQVANTIQQLISGFKEKTDEQCGNTGIGVHDHRDRSEAGSLPAGCA